MYEECTRRESKVRVPLPRRRSQDDFQRSEEGRGQRRIPPIKGQCTAREALALYHAWQGSCTWEVLGQKEGGGSVQDGLGMSLRYIQRLASHMPIMSWCGMRSGWVQHLQSCHSRCGQDHQERVHHPRWSAVDIIFSRVRIVRSSSIRHGP